MQQKEIDPSVYKSARNLLRATDAGILSTFHNFNDGDYPYGSMCPFVLALEGDIVILISDIAMHTKNIKNNNHVSMTVFDTKAKYKQNSERISVIGDARLVSKESDEFKVINERYLNFFPEAKGYFNNHDFNYYIIKPLKAHYIQGFGKIYTFEGEKLRDSMPEWYEGRHSVLEHMNGDHKNALMKYTEKLNLTEVKMDDLKLVEFDQEGFHLATGRGEYHYIHFANKALTTGDLRKEFTALAK